MKGWADGVLHHSASVCGVVCVCVCVCVCVYSHLVHEVPDEGVVHAVFDGAL